jgi:hypothetical protein
MSRSSSPEREEVVRVRVPFAIRKRGGRKLVVVPAGAKALPERPRVDNAMVKALARAFRWRKLLEGGVYGTIEELAAAEKINSSYVSRILRLTLLAPQIVEAILDGRQPEKMTLVVLMEPLSVYWAEQSPPVDAARATDAGEPGSQVPVTPAS